MFDRLIDMIVGRSKEPTLEARVTKVERKVAENDTRLKVLELRAQVKGQDVR